MPEIPETLVDQGLRLLKPSARVPLVVVLSCAAVALLLGTAGWSLSAEHSDTINRVVALEKRADVSELNQAKTVSDQTVTLHRLDQIDGKLDGIKQQIEDRLPSRK